jgi:LAO/AO transport system kinase
VSDHAKPGSEDLDDLITRFFDGDKKALARVITLVEDFPDKAREIIGKIHGHCGNTYVIGITGVLGSGKSSLVTKLTQRIRARGKTVGIISIDPASPFSGGAFLGDRVRMKELFLDSGVFIRSSSARGRIGGMSKATDDMVIVFDAFGKDFVIIETVGAGQSEVGISNIANTTVVVFVPGLGDSIQAQKAGIVEIGDVLVVNKADLEGADSLTVLLEQMLDSYTRQTGWRPPVVLTSAKDDEGIEEFLDEVLRHRNHIELSGILERKRKDRIAQRLQDIVGDMARDYIVESIGGFEGFGKLVDRVHSGGIDPYSAADEIRDHVIDRVRGEDDS